MLPDRVSNPGPLTYKSGALPIALHGPATELSSLIQEPTFKLPKIPADTDLYKRTGVGGQINLPIYNWSSSGSSKTSTSLTTLG